MTNLGELITRLFLCVAQPGSASALGAESREFDPRHTDHLI